MAAAPDTSWTDASGAANTPWSAGGVAVFQGSPGIVTIDDSAGSITFGGLQFAVSGYGITGDDLTTNVPDTVIAVGDGSPAGSSVTATIAASIQGTGGIRKTDFGTLILTGDNGFSGGTVIDGGSLQIGDGGTSGSIVGDVVDNGALIFNRADRTTFEGAITGSGTVAKLGAGTLTLSGASTYSGATAVGSGTLLVNGSLGTSPVTVASGATLGGSGVIAGPVTIADGGHLSPGDGVGTLSLASLVLGHASILDYDLGIPNVVGAGVNDLLTVNGDLTLGGTLNVTDAGGFGNGVYRLIDFSGSLTDNGLVLGTLPNGFDANEFTVQTGQAHQVNLVVQQQLAAGANQFWDGANLLPNGVVDGGSATWSAATVNTDWTNAAGTINAAWASNNLAIFQGTPGTVTVDTSAGAVNVQGIQFAVDGYTITGGALTTTTAATAIRVGDGSAAGAGMSATIAAVIQGTGGLKKTDLGTLVLSGSNTYSGTTTITSGTLQTAAAAGLGTGTTLTFDGTGATAGSLLWTGAGTLAKRLTVAANATGTLATGPGGAVQITSPSYTGNGGAGTLNTGSTLFLNGGITFANNIASGAGGAFYVGSGTLSVNSGSADFALTGNTATGNGGAIASTNVRSIAFTSAGGAFNLVGNTGAQGGAIYSGTVSIDGAFNAITIANNRGTYSTSTSSLTDLSRGGGGAIYAYSTMLINNTAAGGTLTIENNSSGADGGALLAQKGLTISGNYSDILIDSNSNQITSSSRGMGGAIRVTDGPLLIDTVTTGDMIMRGNVAASFGGALDAAYNNSTITLLGSYRSISLTDNISTLNGGGALGAGNTMLIDTATQGALEISRNSAKTSGGALLGYFEGMTLSGSYGSIVVDGNSVSATTGTGAAGGWGGAFYTEKAMLIDPSVTGGFSFTNNVAGIRGGALATGTGGAITIGGNSAGLLFSGNRTSTLGLGGAIYTEGQVTIGGTHNAIVFENNTGPTRGGAIYAGAGFNLSLAAGTTLTATGNKAATNAGGGFLFANAGSMVFDIGAGATATIGDSTSIANAADSIAAGTSVQLFKRGAGVLTLWGANSYTGMTNIEAGTLLVDGSLAGAATVSSGATLGGTGTVSGPVAVQDGGHLAPGDSPGTLTIGGNLVLSSAAILDYEFGQAGTVGGSFNDLVIVGGNLTLDGTLNLTQSSGGALGPGIYRIFNYAGTLSNNTLDFGSVPAGLEPNTNLFIQTAVSKQVNLVVSTGNVTFWDGGNAGLYNNGAVNGGTGTWTSALGGAAWTDSAGLANRPWTADSFAVFQAVPATVVIDNTAGQVAFSGAQFAVGGYTIGGQSLQTDAADTVIRVGDGTAAGASMTATIAAVIQGTGGLDKTDLGTLVLSGQNTYSGGTTVTQGVLSISGDGNLGAAAAGLTLDGGTLLTTAGVVSARAVNLASTGTIDNGGNADAFSGVFSGAGGAIFAGAGTTVLTGENTYTGGTTISGGTLQIGNGGATGSLVGNVINNAALTFNRSSDYTFGGAIGGSGVLNKLGGNTLTLSGQVSSTSSSAGAVSVQAGALTVTGALAVTGAGGGIAIASGAALNIGDGGTAGTVSGTITDNGTVTINRSDDLVLDALVTGTGALTKLGSNTLTLTEDNTYTGLTTIAAGTLQLGTSTQSGSVTGDILDNGTLVYAGQLSATYGGTISGSGAVIKSGAGDWTLTGLNSYSGGTAITMGTLIVPTDASLGLAGAPLSFDGGTLQFTATGQPQNLRPITLDLGGGTIAAPADGLTLAGLITGAGGLTVRGAVTMLGTNTYSGATTISAASSLKIGNGGTAGSISGNVSSSGSLIFDRSDSFDFAGTITGSGAVEQAGPGTTVLTANSSYTGGTTISAGTLQIGDGGASGTIVGNVVDNGRLVFDRADEITFAGTVSGTGGLGKAGSGTLRLTGDSTYAGSTSVDAGRLLVGGSIASAVQVNAGATLGGEGTIGGTVTVLDSGHLAPGEGIGTLTMGPLVLSANSQLDYELGLPGTVGGNANDLIRVGGDLMLDGILNITDEGGFSQGVYRLIDYGGGLIDNGLALGSLPSASSGAGFLIQTSTPGEVNLVVQNGGFALQFWDGPNLAGNGLIDGGTGVWNTAASNWTGADGAINVPWQSGFAVFQGTAGIVTLGGNLAFDGMQFRADGYVITGSGFTLAGTPDTIIRVDPNVSATIDAPIVDGSGGAAKLTKTDDGVLTLAADNGYTGGTAIDGGTLAIERDANLGAASGALEIDGGTLATTASFSSSRIVTLGLDGGAFAPQATTTLTLTGTIGGSGQLAKLGAGTLVLTGANSYAGGTLVTEGVLAIASDAALGSSDSALGIDGGTLRFDAGFDPASTRVVTLGAAGGSIDTNGNVVAFAQPVGGTGALVKLGAGTLILAGDNTYSGDTTIAAGTLQIGNGAASGSVLGNVVNNGTLVFDRSDQYIYAGVVSGSGALVQAGSGTTILTADQSYSSGTTIDAGTLQLGNGGTSGSLSGNVANAGTLAFNRSDDVILTGIVSGTGGLSQLGPGLLTIAGAQSYTGPTQVAAGTLEVAGSLASGAVSVASGATLTGDGRIDGVVAIASGGHLSPGPLATPGSISLGALALADGTQLDWQLGEPEVAGGPLNDIARVDGDLTLDGTLNVTASGGFALLPGSYKLIEYGGALTDNGLAVGPLPAAFASSQVQTAIAGEVNLIAIENGLAVQFWDGSNQTGDGVVSGGDGEWNHSATNWTNVNGRINQQWLSGMGIFSAQGGTVTLGENVSAVALQFTADGYRIEGAGRTLTFADPENTGFAGLIRVDAGVTAEIAVPIAGSAGLTLTDPGTLILSADNNYTGVTTIERGTLQIGAGGIGGSIRGDVVDDGTLIFNRSDTATYTGTISGTGSLEQAGTGTTILTANHSYIGGTTITAGTLQLGNGGASGSVSGNIVDNGTLTFNRSDTATYAGIVSGIGALVQAGPGTTILSGDHSYTGGTTIAAGTLQLGNGGTTGSVVGNILDNGGLVFDRSDVVLFGGTISGTGSMTQAGTGRLILTGANTYGGGTTIAASTLQIGNGGTSGSIEGNVANNGALVFNRSDAIEYAGTISGAGSVTQAGTGTLSLTGASSYGGGTVVNAGILQIGTDASIGAPAGGLTLNSGTLRWAGAFDLAGTRVIDLGRGGGDFDTNGFVTAISQGITGTGILVKSGSGTLSLNGASSYTGLTAVVAGRLSVNGSIRSNTVVYPGATLAGRGTIIGDVLNEGIIAPGNSIGTLTIAGNYRGNGGSLQIETVLAGDQSPADRLVISGGTATGSTSIDVLNQGGLGALTIGDGIPIVQAANGGKTAADAFSLAGPVIAGPYEYSLHRGSASASDDWFLRSVSSNPGPSPRPDYRLETSLYAAIPALALSFGRNLLGTLDTRVGEIGENTAIAKDRGTIWGRTMGRFGHQEGKNLIFGAGPYYDYDFYAFQVGADFIRKTDGDKADFAGVYGAYGSGRAEVTHYTNRRAGQDPFDSYSVGAYWTHFAPAGWYLDGVVQGTWYKMKGQSTRLSELRTDGFGIAASLEGGYKIRSNGIAIEPQAQLIFQSVSLEDSGDAAATVRFTGVQSLAGRSGVKLAQTWMRGSGTDARPVTAWVRGNLWYEFLGNPKTEFSSADGLIPLRADLGGAWGELSTGVTAQLTGNLSFNVSAGSEIGISDGRRSYEGRFGLRLTW
ncbi:autotransporter-associated beta strand repeat-containing protein [Novosphingobium sp. PhB165]|uniref:autotransporter-associated beta strand repeat-containing protein n=1 Tax=Novosphingobium sp. PhB165 TaxID=2485105 RepID=UPI0014043FF5|nr:autotransporter-associated beta strand repeat-containing protein [Novosphingobium sp. PhB165]